MIPMPDNFFDNDISKKTFSNLAYHKFLMNMNNSIAIKT